MGAADNVNNTIDHSENIYVINNKDSCGNNIASNINGINNNGGVSSNVNSNGNGDSSISNNL